MHIRIRNIRHAEQGLVSIVVTMIFLIVLSLIVVGFAQVARREQRESLDRQLSSQAFYAAESGINIAKSAISDSSGTYSSNNAVLNDKGSCGPDGTPPLNNPGVSVRR
jgi:Tfp pilus assembly protein PilX